MKVWDISNSKPSCIFERDAKIGMVHALDGCPDAPFVFALGGDTPSHNMHVMDVRESAKVNERFNEVTLENLQKQGDKQTTLSEMKSSEEATTNMENMESEKSNQAVAA